MKTTATRASLFAAAIALMTAWGAAALANPYLYGSSYHDYEYRYAPERLSRERRAGAELDNWIERGNATVTLSPAFDRGIRVAAWAAGGMEPDNYEYGIASAVYLFDVPYGTRQIKIKIRYEGEGRALDLNRDYAIAGRAWIRSSEVDGANPDEPLQGDTFLLRSGRRSETLEIPADRYVNPEGLMELHIVADGANRIDIDYIEVETFARELRPNVIRRHVPGYRYAPWHAYGYHSLYGSNFYFPTDYGYYLYWDFPVHDSVYIGISRRWRGYYNNYYSSRRYGRYGGYSGYNVYRPAKTNRYRPVNRWTTQLNSVRSSYERGRTADVRSRDIASVRQALSAYRTSPTPSAQIAGAYSQKRRASVSTPGYSTGLKSRGAASTGSRTSTSPTRRSIDYSRYAPSSRSDASRTSPYTRSRTYTPQEERTRPSASSTNRSSSSRSSSSSSKSRSSASSSSSSSGKSRGSASKSSSSDDDDDKKRR